MTVNPEAPIPDLKLHEVPDYHEDHFLACQASLSLNKMNQTRCDAVTQSKISRKAKVVAYSKQRDGQALRLEWGLR